MRKLEKAFQELNDLAMRINEISTDEDYEKYTDLLDDCANFTCDFDNQKFEGTEPLIMTVTKYENQGKRSIPIAGIRYSDCQEFQPVSKSDFQYLMQMLDSDQFVIWSFANTDDLYADSWSMFLVSTEILKDLTIEERDRLKSCLEIFGECKDFTTGNYSIDDKYMVHLCVKEN